LEELSKKIEGGNIQTNNTKESTEEVQDLKTALEHKTYQVEILKKEFTKYEDKAEEQIENLKTENAKLKYRINILLKTIEDLEKKK
jgi:molecular chaperone GrpE (heat shock protein)